MKRRFTSTLLLWLVVNLIKEIEGQECRKEINGVRNKRYHGNTYRFVYGVTRRQCAKQCIAEGSCQSLNYMIHEQECQLIGSLSNGNLIDAENQVYMEKTHLIQEYGDPCALHPCQPLTRCVVLKSGDRHCVISECGLPPIFPEAYAVISRPQVVVGAYVQYTCNPGFRIVTGTTDSIMCLASGMYADVTIQCEQVTCPSLPNFDNAYISHVSVPNTPGAQATYTCNPPHVMSNGQSSLTVTCGTDGTWSDLTSDEFCNKVSCPSPPVLANAEWTSTSYSTLPGAEVKYMCTNPLFIWSNNEALVTYTCGTDGTWSTSTTGLFCMYNYGT